jgi:hypothetical protein
MALVVTRQRYEMLFHMIRILAHAWRVAQRVLWLKTALGNLTVWFGSELRSNLVIKVSIYWHLLVCYTRLAGSHT